MSKFATLKTVPKSFHPYAVVDKCGKVHYLLNKSLIEMRKISPEDLKKITKLHIERIEIKQFMKMLDPKENQKTLFKSHLKCKEIESKLQKLWKYSSDDRFFKFWELPHCTCPKLDNNKRYPFGSYVVSKDCYHALEDPKKAAFEMFLKSQMEDLIILNEQVAKNNEVFQNPKKEVAITLFAAFAMLIVACTAITLLCGVIL